MKHYFKLSAHIILGLIIAIILLLLWRSSAWAPQDVRDVQSSPSTR